MIQKPIVTKDVVPSKIKTENKHIFISKDIIEITDCHGYIQNETGVDMYLKEQFLNSRNMFIYHCKLKNEHSIFQIIITKVWKIVGGAYF